MTVPWIRVMVVKMERSASVLEILRMCIEDVNGWRWRVREDKR